MDNVKKILRSLHKVRLTESERISARSHIVTFMQTHPAQNYAPGFILKTNIFARLSPVLASALVVVVALSGTAAAAQISLPGNALYPIKLGFEKVQVALTASAASKAQLNVAFAEQRLREAEQLITRNLLTTSTKDIIKNNLSDQATMMAGSVALLTQDNKFDDAIDIANSFDAMVSAHDSILQRLSEEDDDGAHEVQEMANTQNESLASIKDQILPKFIAASGTEASTAAKGKRQAASNKISETQNSLKRNRRNVDAESLRDASSRLQEAQELIDAGNSSFSNGAPNDAYTKFQEAHRIAQQAKFLIEVPSALRLKNQLDDNARKAAKQADEEKQTAASSFATTTPPSDTSTVNFLNFDTDRSSRDSGSDDENDD